MKKKKSDPYNSSGLQSFEQMQQKLQVQNTYLSVGFTMTSQIPYYAKRAMEVRSSSIENESRNLYGTPTGGTSHVYLDAAETPRIALSWSIFRHVSASVLPIANPRMPLPNWAIDALMNIQDFTQPTTRKP